MEISNDLSSPSTESEFVVNQLVKIDGIAEKTARAFYDIGIRSYSDLAEYLRQNSVDQVSEALKEHGVNRRAGIINMDELISQAETLSKAEKKAPASPEEGIEVGENQEKTASYREPHEHDALFTVSFDIIKDEEGKPTLSTTVYDEKDSGEEQVFKGNDASKWVSWMFERANFPANFSRDVSVKGERYTQEILKETKHEVRVLPGWEVTIRSELGVTLQEVKKGKAPTISPVSEELESEGQTQPRLETEIPSEEEVVIDVESEEINASEVKEQGQPQTESMLNSGQEPEFAEAGKLEETEKVIPNYPPEPYKAQLKINTVQITPVEPMLSSTEKKLEAEISFQLSGTDAYMLTSNRLPYRLVIYSIEFSKGIPAFVTKLDGQLEPAKYEYSHHLQFAEPAAGKYEYHIVTRVPPEGKLMGDYQGPILTID